MSKRAAKVAAVVEGPPFVDAVPALFVAAGDHSDTGLHALALARGEPLITEEVVDDKGKVTGWNLRPADFSLSGYAATLAALKRERLLAYSAGLRWQIETGGLDIAGVSVATDRASQGMIASAYQLALADPEETVEFKAASGWVSIDAAQMIAIGMAVGKHVRELFRKERGIEAAIVAGTITSEEEIAAAYAIA